MARKRPPSIDFYYDDFFAGVAAMHPLAVGMYIRTICFQLAHKSVPNDTRKLRQITGTTAEEFTEHWPEVRAKLLLTEDGAWINERAQVEMEKKLAIASKRADCGKLGGRPKKQKGKQNESKTKANGKAKRKQNKSIPEEGSRKKEEGRRKGENGSRKKEEDRAADIRTVFGHYRSHHPRAHPKVSSELKEWALIRERLKEGYTVEDLAVAIDGCHRSPYHCGENPGGTKYQSLELIMRDGKHVQQFLEVPEKQSVLSEKERRGQRAAQQFLEGTS